MSHQPLATFVAYVHALSNGKETRARRGEAAMRGHNNNNSERNKSREKIVEKIFLAVERRLDYGSSCARED